MAMKLGGIDEAGRGPVIGPMVICAVTVDEGKLDALKELNVRDSKRVSPRRRGELFEKLTEILDDYVILKLWPEEIDSRRRTLNEFEIENFIKALNSLRVKPDVLYVDAADVKEERFGELIGGRLNFRPRIISEHRADDKYLPVSAASILAKVARDREIERLKEEYGEIGSGYPSDPRTREFLIRYFREHGDFPPIVRRTWKTLKKLEESLRSKEPIQKSLTDFLR